MPSSHLTHMWEIALSQTLNNVCAPNKQLIKTNIEPIFILKGLDFPELTQTGGI